jgi:hypothetical protein
LLLRERMSTNSTIWTSRTHSNVRITVSLVEKKIKLTQFQLTSCATLGLLMESLLFAQMSVKFFFLNRTVITKTFRFLTLRKALSKLTQYFDSQLVKMKGLKKKESLRFKNLVSLLLVILASSEFSLSLTLTFEHRTREQTETILLCLRIAMLSQEFKPTLCIVKSLIWL